MVAQALPHVMEDSFQEGENHMSITNMVWVSLYLHFLLTSGYAANFSFCGGGVEMKVKRSSLRLLRFLLCQSCIIGRGFRCDLMQLPSFTWNSDFRDSQETLMGISYFSCLSHIPLSRNVKNFYH